MISKLKDILGCFLTDPNKVVPMPIPKMKFNPWVHYPRRSGRTNKMLVAALAQFITGKNIIIVLGNAVQRDQVRNQFRILLDGLGLLYDANITRDRITVNLWQGTMIAKFETRTPYRDSFRGIPTDDQPTVFYDHYFSEKCKNGY